MIRRPEHPHPARIYRCPFCEHEMEVGTISLTSSFWRFLAAGWSYSKLDFTANSARPRARKIMDQGESRHAVHCTVCGTVSIFR